MLCNVGASFLCVQTTESESLNPLNVVGNEKGGGSGSRLLLE